MKKLLALVLALVMTLGLATVGTNAAVSDYKDAKSITYEEAVAVMQAIKVMIGDPDGSFRANDYLSRAEAAKIIAYLRLGNETAEKVLVASGTKFSDVPASHWGAKYIEYCAAEGIINGIGNGKFSPDGTLLVIDFAKMLLGALGYDAEIEGMTGADYRIHTSKIANRVGLFDGNSDVVVTANCTRQEAALYAFNAIKTPLVQYANKGSNISVNGAEVQFGASNWEYMTTASSDARYNHIDNAVLNENHAAKIIEFGEQYYPGLILKGDTDAFQRPCSVWTYNNEEVGKFVNKDNLVATYTTGITGKELNELLGDTVVNNCFFDYYVDGAEVVNDILPNNMIRTNTESYAYPGNGALTEVYLFNGDIPTVRIVTINTFFAWADSSYDKSTDQLRLFVYCNGKHANGSYITVYGDEVPEAVNYSKDDPIMVQMTTDNAADYTNAEVRTLEKPAEEKTGVALKEYKANSYVTSTAGEKLTYSKKGNNYETKLHEYNKEALELTYTEYVDNYGYLIYIEAESATKTYLFLTGYDLGTTNIGNATCKANAIFLDGTMKTIEINLTKTSDNILNTAGDAPKYAQYPDLKDKDGIKAIQRNQWFTYKETDGVYTLSPIDPAQVGATKFDEAAADIYPANCRVLDGANGNSVLGTAYGSGAAYGNDKSVFITVAGNAITDAVAGITKVTNVYTGIQTVDIQPYKEGDPGVKDHRGKVNPGGDPVRDTVFWVKDTSNYVIGMVIVGEDAASTKNYAFATGAAEKEYKDGTWTKWDFTAIVDGEEKTLTIRGENYDQVFGEANKINTAADFDAHGSMFLMAFDADGFVTKVEQILDGDSVSPNKDKDKDTNYTAADFGSFKAEAPDWATHSQTNDLKGYKVFDLYHYGDGRTDTLTVKGNVLYAYCEDDVEVEGLSVGLAVKSDAPVFVVRPVATVSTLRNPAKWDQETIKCANLDAALSVLIDANTELDDKQFVGEIAAALNSSTGVAQWVVLESHTPRVIKDTDSTITNPTNTSYTGFTVKAGNPGTFDWIGSKAATGLTWTFTDIDKSNSISGVYHGETSVEALIGNPMVTACDGHACYISIGSYGASWVCKK